MTCPRPFLRHLAALEGDDQSSITPPSNLFMSSNSHRVPVRLPSQRAKPRASGIDEIVAHLRPLLVRELQVHIPPHHVDLALKEAAARAEITGVPALWFPELAREKLAEAQAWWIRQQRIRTLSAVSFAA
jgi:hypothetical protein